MAFNLREHIATAGLRTSIKGNYGIPVDIVFASGNTQLAENAQILYDTENLDPDTGDLISIKNTWITFVKADLDEEIKPTDRAYFKYPKNPSAPTGEKLEGTYDGSKTLIDGQSAGFIRIPITSVIQS